MGKFASSMRQNGNWFFGSFVKILFFETRPLKASFEANKVITLYHSQSILLCKNTSSCFPFSSAVTVVWIDLLKSSGTERAECLELIALRNKPNKSVHFPRDGKSATFESEDTLQYQGKHGSKQSKVSNMTKSSFIESSTLYYTLSLGHPDLPDCRWRKGIGGHPKHSSKQTWQHTARTTLFAPQDARFPKRSKNG